MAKRRKKRAFGDLPEAHVRKGHHSLDVALENADASEFQAKKGNCERSLHYLIHSTVLLGSGQAHAHGARHHLRGLSEARVGVSRALETFKKHCRVR